MWCVFETEFIRPLHAQGFLCAGVLKCCAYFSVYDVEIFKYAISSQQTHLVYTFHQHIEQWISVWGIADDGAPEKRNLYKAMLDVLTELCPTAASTNASSSSTSPLTAAKQSEVSSLRITFAIKYFNTLSGSTADTGSTAHAAMVEDWNANIPTAVDTIALAITNCAPAAYQQLSDLYHVSRSARIALRCLT